MDCGKFGVEFGAPGCTVHIICRRALGIWLADLYLEENLGNRRIVFNSEVKIFTVEKLYQFLDLQRFRTNSYLQCRSNSFEGGGEMAGTGRSSAVRTSSASAKLDTYRYVPPKTIPTAHRAQPPRYATIWYVLISISK